MYFTSSASYALPYYATKPRPTLVVAAIIAGNPYPVVEAPSETGVVGRPLRTGYQSHYVLTERNGSPCKKVRTKGFFDEIVVASETQVLPLLIVEFNQDALIKPALKFAREVVESP